MFPAAQAKTSQMAPSVCVCVSVLSIYIYGLWVKLLFPKGLHIRNERRKWGRERELRKEEDGQAARRKKKKTSTGAGNYAKRPVVPPTGRESLWPYFHFLPSLIFVSRYGLLFFKIIFSPERVSRDSYITPR